MISRLAEANNRFEIKLSKMAACQGMPKYLRAIAWSAKNTIQQIPKIILKRNIDNGDNDIL